jgi:P27 family predicted phage terminase small subunit
MKGRKPTANAVKEATGAFKVHPERRNSDEPKARLGFPKMPECVAMNEVAARRWDWVCKVLNDMNLLAVSDQGLIAGYCMDYAQMLALWEVIKDGNVSMINVQGNAVLRPEANQFHTYADRCLKREAELGLTPSSRSRLRVPQSDEEDVFQAWLREATGTGDN